MFAVLSRLLIQTIQVLLFCIMGQVLMSELEWTKKIIGKLMTNITIGMFYGYSRLIR